MVEKKTTKKETKKTTTSKKTTTPRKTTSSKIKITYNPVGFNEKSTIYFPLYKKNEEGYNVPLIEGLPTSLSFTKGQVMEVTKKQYEDCRKCNKKQKVSSSSAAKRCAKTTRRQTEYAKDGKSSKSNTA